MTTIIKSKQEFAFTNNNRLTILPYCIPEWWEIQAGGDNGVDDGCSWLETGGWTCPSAAEGHHPHRQQGRTTVM